MQYSISKMTARAPNPPAIPPIKAGLTEELEPPLPACVVVSATRIGPAVASVTKTVADRNAEVPFNVAATVISIVTRVLKPASRPRSD